MKWQMFMFLSRLKDEDTNKVAIDESKSNIGSSFNVNDNPNEHYTFIARIDDKM